MPKRIAVFSEDAGHRIHRAVRTIEGQPVTSPAAGQNPHAPVPPNLVALTTSTITARTGTTSAPVWGTGTVQVYRKRNGVDVLADTLTVKNSQTGTIASGIIVQCKWINEAYFVDVGPCS